MFDAFSLKRVTYEFKETILTLNLECREVGDQFLENLEFPYFFCNSTVSKLQKICGKIEILLKTDHRRLATQQY